LLEGGGAQWPAAAQYLPKKDVGALIALFRTLTPWLLNHPDDVAAVAETTERVIGALASLRLAKVKKVADIDGRSVDEWRETIVDACVKGALAREAPALTTSLVLLLLDLILCPAGSSVSPSPRCVH